jgi:polyisoprenoid-binding protein YceI
LSEFCEGRIPAIIESALLCINFSAIGGKRHFSNFGRLQCPQVRDITRLPRPVSLDIIGPMLRSGCLRFPFFTIAFAAVFALGSTSAFSAAGAKREAVFELEPAATTIGFILKGFPHTTSGSFKLKSGEFVVDPETGAATGSIIVDAASGSTGIGMRDREMKSGILEVQRYPEVIFTPRHAQFDPPVHLDFLVRMTGLLLLHGSAHEMTLVLAVHRSGSLFTASTRMTIPYVRWGLKNPSVLFLTVSDDVLLEISTVGHLKWKTVQ